MNIFQDPAIVGNFWCILCSYCWIYAASLLSPLLRQIKILSVCFMFTSFYIFLLVRCAFEIESMWNCFAWNFNHKLARKCWAYSRRQGVLNSCCKGPLVLLYKSDSIYLNFSIVFPQTSWISPLSACLWEEHLAVCILGFFGMPRWLSHHRSFFLLLLWSKLWFYWSLLHDAFSSSKYSTSNLCQKKLDKHHRNYFIVVPTSALAVVFLLQSTALFLLFHIERSKYLILLGIFVL